MAANERLGSAAAAAAVGLASVLLSWAIAGAPHPRVAAARILAAVVVYLWAEDVYGAAAALGAALLFSFHPLTAAAAPQDAGVVPVLLFAAAAYRAQRCLLDPALQDAAAIGAVGAVAAWMTAAAGGLLPMLFAQTVARMMTRGRHEDFGRTLRGCISALVLAAVVMFGFTRLLAAVAVPRDGLSLAGPSLLGAVFWPAPLLLIALRPWRPQRRYADSGAAAALVFPGAAAWWCEGSLLAAARAALPAAAVLAGAVWDGRSGRARASVGWALVAAQIAALGAALF